MNRFFGRTIELLKGTYELVRPFGRRKVAIVLLVVMINALAQMVSVVSIFPFLAVATNTDQFVNSGIGRLLLTWAPGMTPDNVLLYVGMLVIGVLFLSNGSAVVSEYVRNRFGYSYAHWLRMRLVQFYVSQPYSYHVARNSAILIKKAVGDVNGFVSGVLLSLLEIVTRLLTVVLLVGMLLFINAKVAIVVLAVGAGYYLLVFSFLRTRLEALSAGLKESFRGTYLSISQLLGAIKVVIVQGRQDFFLNRFEQPSRKQARLQTLAPVLSTSPRYLLEPIAFGGIVAAVLFLDRSGTSLTNILPTIGLFAFAGYRLMPTLQLLYSQFSGLLTQHFALDEVREELAGVDLSVGKMYHESVPEQLSGFTWERGITLEGVTFYYPESEKAVLHDLNLFIPRQQITAFVGPTGSGKSTLIDLLLGLYVPTSGRILVDDQPLSGAVLQSWRRRVGYVPQDIFLLDDTITRNIAFGMPDREIDIERVRKAAAMAQIGQFIEEELPLGYDTITGERGVRLSGGQRQRIALARALYTNPDVLILDEATSALDNKTESEFMQVIGELSNALTIIMIAHRLTTVFRADCIYYLEEGKIIGEGTYGELLEAVPQFRDLAASY